MIKLIEASKSRRRRQAGFHRLTFLNRDDRGPIRSGRERATICSDRPAILKALDRSSQESVWISPTSQQTQELLEATSISSERRRVRRRTFGGLLMLKPPRPRMLPPLHGWFHPVIGEVPSFKTLPMNQLVEIFSAGSELSRDLFVGGIVDQPTSTLALVRGNLERLTVPLSIFRSSARLQPDFRHFELGDYGHTLRFGEYEATGDLVLWTTDADYRQRAKAKERAHAEGFGPSLRRLRLQRGLSQADFPGLTRRTIARIENGEIEKPHGTTLRRIAKTLGVGPEEIDSY